jgi:hypothetical protein
LCFQEPINSEIVQHKFNLLRFVVHNPAHEILALTEFIYLLVVFSEPALVENVQIFLVVKVTLNICQRSVTLSFFADAFIKSLKKICKKSVAAKSRFCET